MGSLHIQAFVANMTAPTTLDELYDTTITNKYCLLPDVILYMSPDGVEWTVPRWAKIGDVVFFMFAKSARTYLTKVRTEFNNRENDFDEYDCDWIRFWINHGLALHKFYGGKISLLVG